MLEFKEAKAVLIEAPAITKARYEHDMLDLVTKIHNLQTEVMLIVQPSLRRKSNRTLWVQKWNNLKRAPFKFMQTCSCKLGNALRGCHFTVMIGSTRGLLKDACSEVPTLSSTSVASLRSLSGDIAQLLSDFAPCNSPVGPDRQSVRRTGTAGAQRTLNSVDSDLTTNQEPSTANFEDSDTQRAFPTDSKEREKARRKREKEQGIERVVKKIPKIVEEHYDDCGDDLSSIDIDEKLLCMPCGCDTEEELSEEEHDMKLLCDLAVKALARGEWSSYPVDWDNLKQAQPGGDGSDKADPRAPKPADSTCPSCNHCRRKNDWEHTRVIGECRYPYTEPWVPACEPCQERWPRWKGDHTYRMGECVWADKQPRQYGPRTRSSKHPHEPREKRDTEPTANVKAVDDDGVELGADNEERVAEADRLRDDPHPPPVQVGGSSGSGEGQRAEAGDEDENVRRRGNGGRRRGPDVQQRERRAWREAGDNPENPADWSQFDIGRATRLLRTGREGACRLTLRKLHTRWWHATEQQMKEVLNKIGVPDKVKELIPEVVQTCRVCREWARPGPANSTSISLPDNFNKQVECDLLFVHKYIIFHLVDRCTRWEAAGVIPDKTGPTLLKAIDVLWVGIHGPMKELITDGESGIVIDQETQQYLKRKTIDCHARAVDQHARYAERRGALLRDTIHRVEGQLKEEGIANLPFECILADCIFAGNAMLTVNGSTPYSAVYGRVPMMLPGIDQIAEPGETKESNRGSIAHTYRLREVSIQAMIEGSARARLGRALNTRTTPAGEKMNLQVGEEVDFFRQQSQKDASGWFGPAKLLDVSQISRGKVTVKWLSRPMEVRLQDVRRHLYFLALLAGENHVEPHTMSLTGQVWSYIRRTIGVAMSGRLTQVGYIHHKGNWMLSTNNSSHAEMASAIEKFAANSVHLQGYVSGRFGHGLRDIPRISGYDRATILLWLPDSTYARIIELQAHDGNIPRYHVAADHQDWQKLSVLQLLERDGDFADTTNNVTPESSESQSAETTSPTTLETIPEGIEDQSVDDAGSVASTYLKHEDNRWQKHIDKINDDVHKIVEPSKHQDDDEGQRMPLSLLTCSPEDINIGEPIVVSEAEYAELAVYPPMTNTVGLDRQPGPGEIVLLQMGQNTVRQAVVKRDDDLLTPQQLKENWSEVQQAMLKELKTWAELKCFSRRLRAKSRNIIDVRWVIKFKWETPTSDANRGEGQSTEAKVRTIRARLTVRGFKDVDRKDIDRYAGTSSRWAQKVLVSEAVRNGWPICTIDVSKAFLQGVTYEELAELTGEPKREVNFYLPANNIPLLKKIPGFEDFNPQTEVLHCDKPGTGLVDAPRAFSMKLQRVTSNECNMISSLIDQELCMSHAKQKLTAAMTKHVDDLKLTGNSERMNLIMRELQKVFGELKIEWYVFTNCGVRHVQDVRTKEISLDQIHYANNMRTVTHPQLSGGKPTDVCNPELHQLYQSLLGAVAYLSHTRMDVAPFICALQRHTHKPTLYHMRNLNKLLTWVQRNPKKLWYRRFVSSGSQSTETGTHLRVVSDAAFKKETDDGYSLRGAVFCRGAGQDAASFAGESVIVHVVDWACRSQRHVTRSTFSAELLGGGDAIDHGVLLSHLLFELEVGPLTAAEARTRRMSGGYIPLVLYVDAKSVFAAVTATFVKTPAEKSLLSHVQYLRELLDTKIVKSLFWLDTRDMGADGLTKGTVSREALHQLMDGLMVIKHQYEQWQSKSRPNQNIPLQMLCMFSQTVIDEIYPQPPLPDLLCIPEPPVFAFSSAMSFVGSKETRESQSAEAESMMDTTLTPVTEGVKRKANYDQEIGEDVNIYQVLAESWMWADQPVWFNWPIPAVDGLLTDEQSVLNFVQAVREGCLQLTLKNLVCIVFYSHTNGFGNIPSLEIMNPYRLTYAYLAALDSGDQTAYSAEDHFDKLVVAGKHPPADEIAKRILTCQSQGEPASGSQSAEAAPATSGGPQTDAFADVDYGVETQDDEALAGKIEREERKKTLKGYVRTPLGSYEWPDAYEKDGEIWRGEDEKDKSINKNFSVTKIHQYVKALTQSNAVATIHSPETEQPYEHMDDFVSTLRNAPQPGGPFLWPSSKMNFQIAIATALHYCPPGSMVVIKNGLPIPEHMRTGAPVEAKELKQEDAEPQYSQEEWDAWLKNQQSAVNWWARAGGSAWYEYQQPEGQSSSMYSRQWSRPYQKLPTTEVKLTSEDQRVETSEEWRDWYHGTHPHLIPCILAEGIQPSCDATYGAGQTNLTHRFGTAVPMVYAGPSWADAVTYPIYTTTGPVRVPGQKKLGELSGGSLMAMDGSSPMRAMVRFIARTDDRLWVNGPKNQSGFLPQDIFITHVCLYAIHPRLGHFESIRMNPISSTRDEEELNEEAIELLKQRGFTPVSSVLLDQIMASDKPDQPHKLRIRSVQRLQDSEKYHHGVRTIKYVETSKNMLKRKLAGIKPQNRIGTFQTDDPRITARLLGISVEEVQKNSYQGIFTIEAHFQRGISERDDLFQGRLEPRTIHSQWSDEMRRGVEAKTLKPLTYHQELVQQVTKPDPGLLARESRKSEKEAVLTRSQEAATSIALTVGKGKGQKRGRSESQSAEAAQPAEQSRQAQKRAKRWDEKSTADRSAFNRNREITNHNSMLRLVQACYIQTPVDYYESSCGLWRSPEPGEHFDENRVFALIDMDKDNKAESKQNSEEWSSHLQSSTGSSSSRPHIEEVNQKLKEAQIAPDGYVAHPPIDDNAVSSWTTALPFEEERVKGWFESEEVRLSFLDRFVIRTKPNLKWSKIHAWLCNHYPLHRPQVNDPSGSEGQSSEAAVPGAPGPGGVPRADPTPKWLSYVAKHMAFQNEVRDEPWKKPMGQPYDKFLKNLSHVGGHMLDYFKGEIKARGWKKGKVHEVVINGCYMQVWKLYREHLIAVGADPDLFIKKTGVSASWRVADAVGDLFESAAVMMLAASDWRAIIELSELCFWEDRAYAEDEAVANANLHKARLYIPQAIRDQIAGHSTGDFSNWNVGCYSTWVAAHERESVSFYAFGSSAKPKRISPEDNEMVVAALYQNTLGKHVFDVEKARARLEKEQVPDRGGCSTAPERAEPLEAKVLKAGYSKGIEMLSKQSAASFEELAQRCRQYSPVVSQTLKWTRQSCESLKVIYDAEEERSNNWTEPSTSLQSNFVSTGAGETIQGSLSTLPEGREDLDNEAKKTQSFYLNNKGKLVRLSPRRLAKTPWSVKTAFSAGGWTPELDAFAGDKDGNKDMPAEKVVDLVAAKDTDDAFVQDIPDVPFHWVAKYQDRVSPVQYQQSVYPVWKPTLRHKAEERKVFSSGVLQSNAASSSSSTGQWKFGKSKEKKVEQWAAEEGFYMCFPEEKQASPPKKRWGK